MAWCVERFVRRFDPGGRLQARRPALTTSGMDPKPLLSEVKATIVALTETSLALIDASRWADRDRTTWSPLSILGGPLKYWKLSRARKHLAIANEHIAEIRKQRDVARTWPDVDLAMSKLDMVNDLTDALPINVSRVGTPGGPSPIKQQLGVETTVVNQIDTMRVCVDDLLTKVGELRAQLEAV